MENENVFLTIYSDGTWKFGNLDMEKEEELGVEWYNSATIPDYRNIDIQSSSECEFDESNPLTPYFNQCIKSAIRLSPAKVFVSPSGNGYGNWY